MCPPNNQAIHPCSGFFGDDGTESGHRQEETGGPANLAVFGPTWKPEDVESALYKELDRLKSEDLPAEELQKVKNQFAAQEYRKLSANMSILYQLIFNEGYGAWRELNEGGAKLQAVTAADVKRVAAAYLTKENLA